MHILVAFLAITRPFEVRYIIFVQPYTAVGTHLDAHMPEAPFYVAPDAIADFLDIPSAGVRIGVDCKTRLSTEQLVNGNAQTFALDVPQCLVKARQRVIQYRAIPPVRTYIRCLPHVLDIINVTPLAKFIQVNINSRNDNRSTLGERGTAQPIKPGFRSFYLDN